MYPLKNPLFSKYKERLLLNLLMLLMSIKSLFFDTMKNYQISSSIFRQTTLVNKNTVSLMILFVRYMIKTRWLNFTTIL